MPTKKRSRVTSRAASTKRVPPTRMENHIEATNEFLSGNIHWFFKTLGCLLGALTFLVALLALLVMMNGGPLR
jgi:hypothetical protein